jgi:ParB family chromosome partitioning protein
MTESKTVPLSELEHDPVAIEGHEHRLTQLDDLLATLPAEGQLQSLTVRPFAGKPPKKGVAPKYWVTAGNRRLATLRKLRDGKGRVLDLVVTDDWPVHVIIKENDDAGAYASSRAENLMRLPETPVEEFRAFAKMAATMPAKEIAARFGITEKRVKQRLALAQLHPDIIDALDKGKISMESAQAFTVEPDQKKQAAYLKKARGSWELDPRNIKNAFTQKLVRSDSELAKLIGKKAYTEAGGQVLGDAFGSVAYWISQDIIDKLLEDRVAAQKAAWLEEGWLFVESSAEFGQGTYGGELVWHAEKLRPAPLTLPAELAGEHATLSARIKEIIAAYPQLDEDVGYDEVPDGAPEPTEEIEDELATADRRVTEIEEIAGLAFTAEQKAASGVVYWPDARHEPVFGVVRPGADDRKVEAKKPPATLDEPGPTLAAKLALQMTAAIRVKVAAAPLLALQLVVGTLRAQELCEYSRGMPLRIHSDHVAPEVKDRTSPHDDEDISLAKLLAATNGKSIEDLLVELAVLVAPNIDLGRRATTCGRLRPSASRRSPTSSMPIRGRCSIRTSTSRRSPSR